MLSLVITDRARRDIDQVIEQSFFMGGARGAQRYERLIFKAVQTLLSEPLQLSSRDVGGALRLYHMRHAKDRRPRQQDRVGTPRHLLLYAVDEGASSLTLLRLLHDAMDLPAQIEQATAKPRRSQSDSS